MRNLHTPETATPEAARRPERAATDGRPLEPAPDPAFVRAENEDDDGYDPYSDRRPDPEPLFEPDPWD